MPDNPFSESQEQISIRESVAKLAREISNNFDKLIQDSDSQKSLFDKMARLGLTGLTIGETYGGLGMGSTTTAIVMEELSRGDLGAAIFLSVHLMVANSIERFGSQEQKERYLPKLATGELLAAFALTEPSAGSNASELKTYFKQTSDSFLLTGEKCYITSAGTADLYLVFAREYETSGSDYISAFLIDAPTHKLPAGLSISLPDKKMGAELSPIASMSFSHVKTEIKSLLGEIGKGYKIALSGLASGRINIAACANGLSLAALTSALSHLMERKQFNQKLIEFQGLQFMLADMQTKLQAARLLTWKAADSLEKDPQSDENRIHSSMAKCFATDTAMNITTDAVQLLGGAGYLRDYRVEKLMRDAKMLQIVEGTNQIQRVIIAREMVKRGVR